MSADSKQLSDKLDGATKQSGDAYLALPPGECCMKGTLHEGEPRGSFESIADVETYIVKPKDGKGNGNIILYYADVWGMFKNGFLIMDGFADAGYLVVGLDYFRGDPVWKHRKHQKDTTTEPNFDYEAWKRKHWAFAAEAVPKWNQAVKDKYGNSSTKYACVGYCFGAPYVCDSLADGTCAAGAFGHPAFLKESHFYNLKNPLFLSCAEIDHTFPTEFRNRAIDILNAEHKRYYLQVFQGVEHGFALRGDPNDPYERYTKEKSLSGIVEWFDFWLSQ
ncbi:alpha/beta-hydrolase [Rhizodiscina lignyota]|uniref:Alpha/beta-hydrolase n=1 Tax=Rhizodiscina lignyota TaxID=1504668 RepID=A0A9P4IAS9_9PEZI|nr:alpha/beta-hydrolase [Rhizodiscina lignyota]